MELQRTFIDELSSVSNQLSETTLLIEKNKQKVPIPYEENLVLWETKDKLRYRKIQLQECLSFSESECYRLELNENTKTTVEMDLFLQSGKKTILIPYCCRLYYKSYNGHWVSFILSDKLRSSRNVKLQHVSMSQFKKIDVLRVFGHVTPEDSFDILINIICDTVDSIEPVQETAIVPLKEPIYILAQSHKDRKGFGTVQRGCTLYEKKYGDGPLYPIIALLIHS